MELSQKVDDNVVAEEDEVDEVEEEELEEDEDQQPQPQMPPVRFEKCLFVVC
jgi:hypothetical protein